MFDDLLQYLRELKVFALGKGVLSLAVFGTAAAASAFLGASVIWPVTLVVGIGGTALTAVNRLYKQSLREQEMVDIYRDGIAAQLHIAPEQVTRASLREAGEDNPIIGQALDRMHKKTVLTIATAAAAGIVSVALINVFDMGNLLHGLAKTSLTGMLEPIASLIGMGTVSTMTGLVVHDGLDAVIGHSTGINHNSAHDLIADMHRRVRRGQPVSREQVYGVLVAGDSVLDRTIQQRTGKHYNALNHAEQSMLLQHFGVAEQMDQLARDVSTRVVSPGNLAFLTTDAYRPTLSLLDTPQDTPQHGKGRFVDRLGLKPQQSGHVERLSAQTAATTANAR